MASDGVARGGTGSVVVSRCVCSCVGRVASVASVARHEVVGGSARRKRMGGGLSRIRES